MSGSSASLPRFELIRVLGRFIKVLTCKPSDVQDAMAKLERLSTQEVQMVVATTLAAVNHIDLDLTAMRRKYYHRRYYLN